MRVKKNEPLLGAKDIDEFHEAMADDLKELCAAPRNRIYRLGWRKMHNEIQIYQSQIDNLLGQFVKPRVDRRPHMLLHNGLLRTVINDSGSPLLKAYMNKYA